MKLGWFRVSVQILNLAHFYKKAYYVIHELLTESRYSSEQTCL